jgi:hypothetical protein
MEENAVSLPFQEEEIQPARIIDGREFLTFDQAVVYWDMSKAGFNDAVERLKLPVYQIPAGSRKRYVPKDALDQAAVPVLIRGEERTKTRMERLEELVHSYLTATTRDDIEQLEIDQLNQKARQLLEEK